MYNISYAQVATSNLHSSKLALLFFLSNYWYIDDLSIGEIYLGKVLYSGLNMVFPWSAGRVSSSLAALLLLVLMIY